MTRLRPSRACPRFCTDQITPAVTHQPTKETHVARTTHRPPQGHVVAGRDRGLPRALLLATPAIGRAEEANPNNYSCFGSLAAGKPEVGSEEQQVAYAFHCNGPITGYQLQSQIPMTGVEASPLVSNIPSGTPVTDTFSCSGEIPGYADNCVGATRNGQYETIAGQFSIGAKLCAEPRVDPLLTVTYAYLEKGVVTQAISGPFDLGRPTGCPPDANSGLTRLNPKPVALATTGKHKGARARERAKARRAPAKKEGRPRRSSPHRRPRPRGLTHARAGPRVQAARPDERRSPANRAGGHARALRSEAVNTAPSGRTGSPRPRSRLHGRRVRCSRSSPPSACSPGAARRPPPTAAHRASATATAPRARRRLARHPAGTAPRRSRARSARSPRASTTRPPPAATSPRRCIACRAHPRCRRRQQRRPGRRPRPRCENCCWARSSASRCCAPGTCSRRRARAPRSRPCAARSRAHRRRSCCRPSPTAATCRSSTRSPARRSC